MTDPSLDDFSAASSAPIVQAACAAIGHAGRDVELLRLGENAIYRILDAPIVVRVARSLQMLDDVRKEMRAARWLEEAGLPAVRLADENGDEPLIVLDRFPVTFWRLVRSTPPKPSLADLGRLLRQLHELEPPEWVQLPAFSPPLRPGRRAS